MSAKGKGKYAYLGLGPMRPRHADGKRSDPIRLYRIWRKMIMRTSQRPSWVKFRCAKYYAGVTICEEWRHDFGAFWFWAMLTGYRDDLTIDRIDGKCGYCPENCRWATRSQQSYNRHYSEAYREAARRNGAKGRAVIEANRKKRKAAGRAAAQNGKGV
jgi:hypothetical protein